MTSEFQKARRRARWYRVSNFLNSPVSFLFAVTVVVIAIAAITLISIDARADGPAPPNIIHVQELPAPSVWSLELRGGAGSEGLIEATLMRATDMPMTVGATIGWVGQPGSSESSVTTTTTTKCWHKHHCGPGSTTTTSRSSSKEGVGLVLYQAEIQYEFGEWKEIRPYFGFSLGGFSTDFGATGVVGLRLSAGPVDAGLAYRILASPGLGSALHAVVVTVSPRW